MKSALDNPQVVREYLALKSKLGRIEGPPDQGVPSVIINQFGVIPKPHQPGKWCLIMDLSHPKGSSVNDGIESELCSLSYASVDDAVSMILQEGQGTLLAKLDLKCVSHNTSSPSRSSPPWYAVRKKNSMWIQRYHLGCVQHRKSSQRLPMGSRG